MEDITKLLNKMKEADKPRLEAKAESLQHPKAKKQNPTIINKRAYLKGLMGRRR